MQFKKAALQKAEPLRMPDSSGRSGRFRGIRLAVAFALLLLCIIIITRPHASTRRTSRPRRPRMQRQMDTRIIMKKDTARIAVSLQNAAESAVHAEAAQQVAGAQLDASEQAVFCFAVNCIIMRTSLK